MDLTENQRRFVNGERAVRAIARLHPWWFNLDETYRPGPSGWARRERTCARMNCRRMGIPWATLAEPSTLHPSGLNRAARRERRPFGRTLPW